MPGFCNMMFAHGGAEFIIFVSPLPFCDLGSQFWCWPWHIGHCTIKAWLDVSPENKWSNLILSLSQVICQGAKPILGLPLPLNFTGNVGARHEELSGDWGRRSHVVRAVPPCPEPPGLSSALWCSSSHTAHGQGVPQESQALLSLAQLCSGVLWRRHPAQQVETLLGCSSPPSLSPAALNWTLGSGTLLKLCTSVMSWYLSANELHQWLAGYGFKQ